MHSLNLLRTLVYLVAAGALACSSSAWAQDPAQGGGTAKLRLIVQEPVATNLHVSVVPADTCKSVSDLWVSGGAERFYAPRIGMLDSQAIREGVVEIEVPSGKPIGIPVNMHLAKLRWSQILFATNPAMGDSIRNAQPGICQNVVFSPRSGGQYEVTYAAGPNYCRVSIAELVDRSGVTDRIGVDIPAMSVQRMGRKKYSCGAP